MMKLWSNEQFTRHIITEFNKIQDEIITETGIIHNSIDPTELLDNNWVEIVAYPKIPYSKLYRANLEEMGNKLANDIKGNFIDIIKKYQYTEISNIMIIEANNPAELNVGWVVFSNVR